MVTIILLIQNSSLTFLWAHPIRPIVTRLTFRFQNGTRSYNVSKRLPLRQEAGSNQTKPVLSNLMANYS